MASSIVILTHNKFDLTQRLLEDLNRHENDNIFEVIVVDNGSTDIRPLKTPLPMGYIRIEENVGFAPGFNRGLMAASKSADLVFAISNDVRISGRFIKQAEDVVKDGRKYLIGNRLLSGNTGWNTFGGKVFEYLEGYFLATTPAGWQELGYFDDNYAPYDFEDVDLSTAAKKMGFKLTTLNSPVIQHAGGGTIGYNPTREAITKRNQKYFESKWIK